MNGVRAGSFRIPNYREGNFSVRNIGFKPNFLFLWAMDTTIPGTSGLSTVSAFSFAGVDSTGALIQCGQYVGLDEGGVDSGRIKGRKSLVKLQPTAPNGGVNGVRLVSLDPDGFTLEAAADWRPRTWRYIAIYHATAYAKIVEWVTNTSIGNQAVNAGLSSAPSLVVHTSLGATTLGEDVAAPNRMCLGMMNTTGQQWAIANSIGTTGSASVTNRRSSPSHAILLNSDTADSEIAAGTYVSMNSTGFTVNWAAAPSAAYAITSVCIVGLTNRLGTFNKSTGAAPATQAITGLGINPDGVLFATAQQTTSGTVNPTATLGIGAGDGENDCGVAGGAVDNVSPFDLNTLGHYGRSALKANNTTVTHEAHGYVSTLDTGGFTVIWDKNDAVATEFFYLAITAPLTSAGAHATTALLAGDQITGPVLSRIQASAVVPTSPPLAGSLWIDTSQDPAKLRIANGNRWEPIFAQYDRLLGTRSGRSVTNTQEYAALASWAFDELDRYSGLRLETVLTFVSTGGQVLLRLNGSNNQYHVTHVLRVSGSGIHDIQVHIPPIWLLDMSAISLSTCVETRLASSSVSLGFTPVPWGPLDTAAGITRVDLIAKADPGGGQVKSGISTLYALDRNFYDYSV